MAEQLVAMPTSFGLDSDRAIFVALRRQLWEYEPLRATRPQLDLEVVNGTVRLAGRVRTLAMKEIVGYICQRSEGVNAVRNDLVSDTEVAQQVANSFSRDDELGPLCLRVDVRDGVATLSGDLVTPDQESRAVAVARTTDSVADIVSDLSVRPPERPATAPLKKVSTPPTETALSSGPAAG